MKNEIICSVAMATYNGEKFIEEQIDSILKNLSKYDEIVISDDGSTDKTLDIIKKYQLNDKRIKLIQGPKNGVKQNFANAIKNCNGKYIFLADQDDVWMNNKVKKMLKVLQEEGCVVAVHNAEIVDQNLSPIKQTFFEFRNSGSGIIKNIIKNTYIGCCMAFKSELKEKILPIPNNIEMHDQWIGIIGEKYGNSIFIEECLIKYRRHGSNVSNFKHHPLKKMIINRFLFIKNYIRR